MSEKLLLICIGIIIGIVLVGGIALIIAVDDDHEYLEEEERDEKSFKQDY